VQGILENPDQIRMSRKDTRVYLFYGTERPGRWICAVVKKLNGSGFLITAYPTDAVKEGETVWHR
ncbi:MAG TPA: hypothetical protein PKH07_04095, partial [bacterium]|nr:hypothetical protein [bacterium]